MSKIGKFEEIRHNKHLSDYHETKDIAVSLASDRKKVSQNKREDHSEQKYFSKYR